MGVAVAVVSIGFSPAVSHAYTVDPAPLAWEPDGPVHDIVVHGNRMYVAGEFTGGIAALNATTGELLWTASADNIVLAVAVSGDGSRVMAGGNFVTVNGEARKRLVAFNAADGSIVDNWRPRASGKVLSMAVHDGIVYIGGRFGSLSGSGLKGLGAVYVSSGQRVLSFNHYVDEPVEAVVVGGGRVIVSGSFTSVDGSPRASIASIDLGSYALTQWAPTRICPKCANYKALATDGVNAYIGSSGPGGKFAAFDLDTGAQPWPMVFTDGDVQAVSVGFDGYVYIGGHFSQYVRTYSNPRTQMASIHATTGAVGPFNPVMYNNYPGVLAVFATPDELYVGGTFSGVQVNGENNHKRFLAGFAD
ncbi:MAG: PQQ-binding-like beta-propeller repeat protein [Nocardioidaceae bacterium]